MKGFFISRNVLRYFLRYFLERVADTNTFREAWQRADAAHMKCRFFGEPCQPRTKDTRSSTALLLLARETGWHAAHRAPQWRWGFAPR